MLFSLRLPTKRIRLSGKLRPSWGTLSTGFLLWGAHLLRQAQVKRPQARTSCAHPRKRWALVPKLWLSPGLSTNARQGAQATLSPAPLRQTAGGQLQAAAVWGSCQLRSAAPPASFLFIRSVRAATCREGTSGLLPSFLWRTDAAI